MWPIPTVPHTPIAHCASIAHVLYTPVPHTPCTSLAPVPHCPCAPYPLYPFAPVAHMAYCPRSMGHKGQWGTGDNGVQVYDAHGQWVHRGSCGTGGMGYRSWGGLSNVSESQKMSSCQTDVKCQKNQTPRLWRRFPENKLTQWGSHILMSILMWHKMVSKNPQNVLRKYFGQFWWPSYLM